MIVAELVELLDRQAPFAGTADWDFGGLQVGDPGSRVVRAAVCHEVTEAVVERVAEDPPGVLVTYHPLLFASTRSMVAGRSPQGRAHRLIRAGVAVVVTHTAFDAAPGGAADALADAIGLVGVEGIGEEVAGFFVGRVGEMTEPITVGELATRLSPRLGVSTCQVSDPEKKVRRVAVIPGSGSSFIAEAAAAGAEVVVTGDVSHHRVVAAADAGVAIVDPGHVASERPGLARLVSIVARMVDTTDLTELDADPWR